MKNKIVSSPLSLFRILMLFAVSLWQSKVSSDDIDLYLTQSNDVSVPNVMLILDTSRSMNWTLVTGDSSNMNEHQYYDPNKRYPASENYQGGAGKDGYLYLYRWEQKAIPKAKTWRFEFQNKVPRVRLDPACPINNALYPGKKPKDPNDTVNGDFYGYRKGKSSVIKPVCRYTDKQCALPNADEPNVRFYCKKRVPTGIKKLFDGEKLYAFTANQHNFLQQHYRYTILKTAVKNFIDYLFTENINVNLAISEFHNKTEGSLFFLPFTELMPKNQNVVTKQKLWQSLKDKIDALPIDPVVGTPLVESLWEGAAYFRGETSPFNKKPLNAKGSMVNNRYRSPITNACQKNKILMVTDGATFADTAANKFITQLKVPEDSGFWNESGTYVCDKKEKSGGLTGNGQCGEEVVDWLSRSDHSKLEGDQPIEVYAVGISGVQKKLDLLKGFVSRPSNYFGVSDLSQLNAAFGNFAQEVEQVIHPLSPPIFSVNINNRLEHGDQLFFSLFEPNASTRWLGNVKRYRLGSDGAIYDKKQQKILSDNGYFLSQSQSWWSPEIDAGEVSKGGVATSVAKKKGASFSTPNKRKLFTWWGKDKTLTAVANRWPVDSKKDGMTDKDFPARNSKAFKSSMSVSQSYDDDQFLTMMEWARGGHPDRPEPFTADFIHSRPAVVSYYNKKGKKTVDETLFAGSNLGFLHAFNANNGNETFAFMPKELLGNVADYYANKNMSKVRKEGQAKNKTFAAGNSIFAPGKKEKYQPGKRSPWKKTYGLDATPVIWHNDANNDGRVLNRPGAKNPQKGEFVYLYQAMRRGGSHLFALDVTRRYAPKVLWQISGTVNQQVDNVQDAQSKGKSKKGGASDASTSGGPEFADLGQTWSLPQRAKIRYCSNAKRCKPREVLIFGGGYDIRYDDLDKANKPTQDKAVDLGSAIYMVDAKTGKKIWSAGSPLGRQPHNYTNTSMRYSMVADVTVSDIDGDDFADYLHAVDIRGQLWRFDLRQQIKLGQSPVLNGGRIANMQGGKAEQQRFFLGQPDVALFADRRQEGRYLSVTVISGHRPHPRLETVQDGAFVMLDPFPFNPWPWKDRRKRNLQPIELAQFQVIGGQTEDDLKALKSKKKLQGNLEKLKKAMGNKKGLMGFASKDYGSVNTPMKVLQANSGQTPIGLYWPLMKGEKGFSSAVTFAGRVYFTTFLPHQLQRLKCKPVGLGESRLRSINLTAWLLGQIAEPVVSSQLLNHMGIPPKPMIYLGQTCEGNCNDTSHDAKICVGMSCQDTGAGSVNYWFKTYWREKDSSVTQSSEDA